MTIDSKYIPEERGPTDEGTKTRYYYEFETATDSEVEVWLILSTGMRIKLNQVDIN